VFSLLSPGENLKAQKAAPAPSNATPPAQQWPAYIWFGKIKRWPRQRPARPRLLHNNAPHLFGLENLIDGHHYLLQRHATLHNNIWFGKFKRWPPLNLATSCHLHNNFWFGKFKRWPPQPLAPPRHLHNNGQKVFGLENLKDGRHYLLLRHATCTTLVRIYLVWKI
jgi:hypothetical protein